MTMWRNHLTVALRSFGQAPAFALINLFGLAVGIAACVLILLYVRYESSYDRWLPDSGRIYQVQTVLHEPDQPVTRSQNSPFPIRDLIAGAFPQIEAVSVLSAGQTVSERDGQPVFIDAQTVDPSFFEIFQLEFLHGSAKTALPDLNSVVLTESEAIKAFGTSDVLGRTISIGAGPGKRDKLISGVLRDLPKNSSLHLALLSRNDPTFWQYYPAGFTGWAGMNQQHYVKLREGADAGAINAALPAWEKRVIPPTGADGAASARAETLDLALVPIGDVHLGAAQQGALAPGGDRRALATFAVVALLTLGMAVMNFVNLATARATLRAREIGLRKLLGATRRQLVVQLLGESVLLCAIATLLALAAIELALPWINARIGATLDLAYLGEQGTLLPVLALLALTGLGGGLYPAFYLSGFRPAAALKANRSAPDSAGGQRLRKGLVVLQFAVAIGLIVCTAVIFAQTRYVETVDPGYRRDGLIQIDAAWRFAGDSTEYAQAYGEMMKLPGVVASGRTNLGLAATNKGSTAVRLAGASDDLAVGAYAIDPGFFKTMDMRLLAGRLFDDRFARDRVLRAEDPEDAAQTAAAKAELRAHGTAIVINRNAARLFGYRAPQQAIGKTVRIGIDDGELIPASIVGVVEDTRIRTARDPIEPIVYLYDPPRTSQVIVRYAAARPGEVMDGLNRIWRRFEPEIPFEARFAEDIVAETYAADRARGALFAAFSGLAIVIACLGLYSLAAFTADRRTKEIGIRKVFGATVRDIVRLLAWQFTKPVVLANLIAWPVAWWAMRDWLNTFDARIALTPGPFVLAALIALAIAVGTVASHAIRVARANPIHALRYE